MMVAGIEKRAVALKQFPTVFMIYTMNVLIAQRFTRQKTVDDARSGLNTGSKSASVISVVGTDIYFMWMNGPKTWPMSMESSAIGLVTGPGVIRQSTREIRLFVATADLQDVVRLTTSRSYLNCSPPSLIASAFVV